MRYPLQHHAREVCIHPFIAALTGIGFIAIASSAVASDGLTVRVDGLTGGQPVPEANVRCKPSPDGKSTDGPNQQPTILWKGAPATTDSFAVFIMDPDVPADFSDAGKEGKTIAADAKRQDFYHYAAVNIPATASMLPGSNADKDAGYQPMLLDNDMGINGYVKPMGAYGGPCPPWNDQRVHNYHFIVLALAKGAPISVPNTVSSAKPGDHSNNARRTFERLMASPQLLAHGTVIGTYTLNPGLRKK
jgi:phosphatidylethanolamine-binding protein (PEBP) family uncharacterized protein